MAILVGGVAGAIFAAGTVPEPTCVEGDSMCTLQKLYLAQTMKVVGGMAAGYLLAALVVVKAPNAVKDRQAAQRRSQYKAASRAAQADKVTVDARAARAAFEQAQRPVGLPAAAMTAIAQQRGGGPPPPAPGASARAQQLAAMEAALMGPPGGPQARMPFSGAPGGLPPRPRGGAVPFTGAPALAAYGTPAGLPPQALGGRGPGAAPAGYDPRRPAPPADDPLGRDAETFARHADPWGRAARSGLPAPAALGSRALNAPAALPAAALRAARSARPAPPVPAPPRPAAFAPSQPAGLPAAALRANAAARAGGLRARPPAQPSRSGSPTGLRARPAPPPPGQAPYGR